MVKEVNTMKERLVALHWNKGRVALQARLQQDKLPTCEVRRPKDFPASRKHQQITGARTVVQGTRVHPKQAAELVSVVCEVLALEA